MSTTKTVLDLAQRVVEILGQTAAEEEPSTEDVALISRVYANRYEEWFFRSVFWWPVAEIPNMAFESLAGLIADDVCMSYGMTAPEVSDENGQRITIGTKGLRNLRRLAQIEKSGLPTVGVYF